MAVEPPPDIALDIAVQTPQDMAVKPLPDIVSLDISFRTPQDMGVEPPTDIVPLGAAV